MVGRLRLWSGYVLFFYVVTHLLNHALGLISLRVLEAGRHLVRLHLAQSARPDRALWRAVRHFSLALWSLVPAPVAEAVALGMDAVDPGRAIIPLGAIHVVGTRLAHELYDVEPGYPWVLGSLVVGGWTGIVRQFSLPLVVWLHACIGLHFAWRLRPWYRDLAAGALCRRPAGAGRRHRRRRHRACATSPSWPSSRAS